MSEFPNLQVSDKVACVAFPRPVILTIAGFDPSSGAGVTADIKTIAAHDCYGVACITAMTVQSTQGVRKVLPQDAGLVTETLNELAGDFELAAVHIGMLASQEVASAVAGFLQARRQVNVVLDPVLKSSSGADLIDQNGAKLLVEKLLPLATVITPNLDEAAALAGLEVAHREQMLTAATKLHTLGACAVVVTGGHLERPVDLLSLNTTAGMQHEFFLGQRLESRSTHGTGCAFSTALACELALGKELRQATLLAKNYVAEAIASAYPVGKGTGPLNHLFMAAKSAKKTG